MLRDSFYQQLISKPDLTCKEYVEKVYVDSYDMVLAHVSKRVSDLENICNDDIIDEINMYMVEYLTKKFGTKSMCQYYGKLILTAETNIIKRLQCLSEERTNCIEVISYDTVVDVMPSPADDEGYMSNLLSKLTRVLFKGNSVKKRGITEIQKSVVFEKVGMIDGEKKTFAKVARMKGVNINCVRKLYLHGLYNIRKEMRELDEEQDIESTIW